MANGEDGCTFDSITSAFELLNVSIKNATKNKNILSTRLDRAISLKREVELKEKAAKRAKEEAATSSLEILAKVEALKQKQQLVKEANDMMRSALKLRRNNAIREKEFADNEKLEKEKQALEALASEESQMLKLVNESNLLKQEAVETSQLQDLLKERESVVNILHGEVSDKYQDISLFIERLDQPVKMNGSRAGPKGVPGGRPCQASDFPGHMLFPNFFTASEFSKPALNGSSEVKRAVRVVADVTEVGHSVSNKSYVASSQTYAERVAAPLIAKHDGKQRKRGKRKKGRRIASAGEYHSG